MKKILIVDDEKLFLKSLSEALEAYKEEFQVITANNGKQAVRVLESETVDLLVTDLRMPEMDGFALVAYVAENLPDLPVIVITAFGTPEIENQLKNFTIGFIDKPINFQNFVQQIRAILTETAFGKLHGISLFGFLQLIEIEKKSCTVIVESGDKVGKLYFFSGKFVGAETANLKDLPAAYEILFWEDTKIRIGKPPSKSVQKVSMKITDLLLQAADLRDKSRSKEEDLPDSVAFDSVEKAKSPIEQGLPLTVDARKFTEFIEKILQEFVTLESVLGISIFDLKDGRIFDYKGNENERIKKLAQIVVELSSAETKILQQILPNEAIEEIIVNLEAQHFLIQTLNYNRQIAVLLILAQEYGLPFARLSLQKITNKPFSE